MKKVLVYCIALMVLVAFSSFATGAKKAAKAPGKHQIKNNTITIAWIPKALNNPVFEIGREGALKKAQELTVKGPYPMEILYVASVASDIAEQAGVVENVIAAAVVGETREQKSAHPARSYSRVATTSPDVEAFLPLRPSAD